MAESISFYRKSRVSPNEESELRGAITAFVREQYGLPVRNQPVSLGQGQTIIYESGEAMLQFTSLWPNRPKGAANSCIFHARMPRDDRTQSLRRSLHGIMCDLGYKEVDLSTALMDF